jgi:hypothetical protein
MGDEVSDWDDDDFDNDHQGQQQQPSKGGGMRAQLEEALKQNKELRKQLDTATKQLRSEAVARVIQGKGLKAKVAKLIPGDVEPNEEAITKWLDEWGDVFGVDNLKEPAKEPEGTPAPKPAVEPNHDDDLSNAAYADQMRRMGQLTGQGQAPMKESDVMAKLTDPNTDRKELLNLIAQHGGGYGTG